MQVKRYNSTQIPNSVNSGNEKDLLSKHELKIKNKCQGKPEKPPNSGYNLFSKEFLSGKKGHWKGLSDEKREQYNQRSKSLKCDYKIKYAAYLERLDPVQRLAKVTGSIKTLKRVAANKKTEEQPVVKNRKSSPKEGVLASKSQDHSLHPAKRHSFAALMRKGEKDEELSDFSEETFEDQSGQASDEYDNFSLIYRNHLDCF
uniref:HMG box domain-containing protein n=1 Tax=Daphnia galeata TaxID=27404 RepID=A0A8J2WGT9_9CRUS|nr:unnamed protein product [Daphnia galeata]